MDNVPSMDPADNDSVLGTLRLVLRKFLAQTDDMLPARVIAYDRSTNRANVQPMVQMVTTGGQKVSRAQVVSVPVLNVGGGGFVLSFPIQPGDLGWIKASDRDMSLFLQSYAEAFPNTGRMHTFSDGLFIPDVMTGWSIGEADTANAVLQSLDGSVKVSLGAADITLSVGAATVTLTASSLVSTVPITAPDFVTPTIPSYNAHDHDVLNVANGSATKTTTAPNP